MLFMRDSKNKRLLLTIAVVALVFGAVLYWWQRCNVLWVQPSSDVAVENKTLSENLRVFIDVTNEVSGIQSGAVYNYTFVRFGNPVNFSLMRCRDEVRCDSVDEITVAKFEQPNQPSPDNAEVDQKTGQVISLHRAVPGFVGGDLPQSEIESKVREFLTRVYPEFASVEPTLAFSPSMKGVRLNNGNYFYRWENQNYTLPDDLSAELAPFIQVGITSNGFIFSYDNTINISREALADL